MFYLYIVCLALAGFALVPLLSILSDVLDTVRFQVVQAWWAFQDASSQFYFLIKTHVDSYRVNKSIERKEKESPVIWLTPQQRVYPKEYKRRAYVHALDYTDRASPVPKFRNLSHRTDNVLHNHQLFLKELMSCPS